MDREEVIKYMESWENHMSDNNGIEEAEAFHMAIKALKSFGCTGCEHYDQQVNAMICKDCRRYYKDRHTSIKEY